MPTHKKEKCEITKPTPPRKEKRRARAGKTKIKSPNDKDFSALVMSLRRSCGAPQGELAFKTKKNTIPPCIVPMPRRLAGSLGAKRAGLRAAPPRVFEQVTGAPSAPSPALRLSAAPRPRQLFACVRKPPGRRSAGPLGRQPFASLSASPAAHGLTHPALSGLHFATTRTAPVCQGLALQPVAVWLARRRGQT